MTFYHIELNLHVNFQSLLETISVPSRVILMVHTIRLSEGTLEVGFLMLSNFLCFL